MLTTQFQRVNWISIIFCISIIFLLLVICNYLAGALCLLFFNQDPQLVQINTYWYAWQHSYAPSKTSKIVVLSGGLSLFFCFLPVFLFFVTSQKKNPNLHGQAHFATEKEISNQGFFSSTGLIVGQWGKRFLRFPGTEFVLLSAPTRSGKGVSTVIPTLLSFTDSVVVLDIKGENFQTTSRYRSEHLGHQVFYWNPFSENSTRWNPLSYVSNHQHLMARDLMALAVIIYPDDPHNPFFSNSSRNMFVALGLLVLESPELTHTIGEIVRQATGKGIGLREYLLTVLRKRSQRSELSSKTSSVQNAFISNFSSQCVDSIHSLLQNSDETLKNIQSSFMAPLSPWLIPLVDKATSENDFDLRQLRQQKITIYLHIPAGEILQAGFILNLFFSQLINENVRELPEENSLLRYQCLLLLDEFSSIGKIDIIAKAIGFIAGYNLRLLMVIQDKAQLVACYGKEDAQNIISNMGLLVCFTPKQLEEAENLSKIIGDRSVTVHSVQHANVGILNGGQYSQSLSVSEQKRPVMLPQELLSLSHKKLLLIRPGMSVINAKKIFYYENSYFFSKLLKVRHTERQVAGNRRCIPIPLDLPTADWSAFNQSIQSSNHYLDPSSLEFNTITTKLPESVLDSNSLEALTTSFVELFLTQYNS